MATMSPLRRRMIEGLTVRNLSPGTQRPYLHAVAKFSRCFGRSPDRLGLEDVRAFQVHLVSTGISWPALNQTVGALRFFYGVTLGHGEIRDISHVRKNIRKSNFFPCSFEFRKTSSKSRSVGRALVSSRHAIVARDRQKRALRDHELRRDPPRMIARYRKAFCRCQGAISLFDFGLTATNIAEQFDEWSRWFGRCQDCHIAAWLDGDRAACEGALLDAGKAREQWHTGPARPQFIPGVEACHNGPIPIAAINAVLLVTRDNYAQFLMCDHCTVDLSEALDAFTRKLSPLPSDAAVEILRGGWARVARYRRAGENDEPR